MSIKFLSINKQYRRLFQGPIDTTSSWDDLNKLEEYLRSPTCYVNQILGCNGKAYIVAEQNSEKVLVEIGQTSNNGGGNVEIPDNIMDILNNKSDIGHKHTSDDIEGLINGDTLIIAGYHIGPEPPENTNLLWIDTSEQSIDTSIDSILINEMKSIISNMSKEIEKLKEEIESLKQNGFNPNPDPDEDIEFNILLENGDILITEDGNNIILEDYIHQSNDYNILSEIGDTFITEDGNVIVLEDYSKEELINYLLTEDGFKLLSENLDNFILEDF